uniref:Uncharacterized protein n=1 Tax=Oryza sativa subsp. japonica TaxID=39947 RepID=Q84J83_ORYSJ|nr:hypothetical protein [Oryza sativa Japonica Group]AAO73259.1 hypothetical protein [Oryza sativa Japonica Group]
MAGARQGRHGCGGSSGTAQHSNGGDTNSSDVAAMHGWQQAVHGRQRRHVALGGCDARGQPTVDSVHRGTGACALHKEDHVAAMAAQRGEVVLTWRHEGTDAWPRGNATRTA